MIVKRLSVNKTGLLVFCLGMLLSVSACKKDDPTTGEDPPAGEETNVKQTPTTDRVELTNDSIFLYAKQLYYWNDALPSYDNFEPRKYKSANELQGYEQELFDITQFKIDPSTKRPYEYTGDSYSKYSYISNKDDDNPEPIASFRKAVNEVDLKGVGNDFGLRPVSYLTSPAGEDGAFILFVTAVYPGSPAAVAGVKRGWAIQKINGKAIGTNYNTDRVFMNNALNGLTVELEGTKFEDGVKGATFKVTLNKEVYKSSPVYVSKVFTAGAKKVGYLAYARFSDEKNSFAVLNTAFQKFSTEGVTDLIVDLRYNGGGYVYTAEHLSNLIAPSTATGVMYVEHFNKTMQDKKATILKNQPDEDRPGSTYFDIDFTPERNTFNFSKKGPLTGVRNVVFIVSRYTASASELVINSLKPHMNVKLVGETTYGKPIGFFPILIQNKYEVFMSMFETKNSKGEGGYFAGMRPDYIENDREQDFYDNPTYELGDKEEGYLAKALSVIAPGSNAVGAARKATMSVGGKNVPTSNLPKMKKVEEIEEFKGMIEDRHRRN